MSIAISATANAGGLLTNTNQNVAFLRNPSRDAAIGIDGVYSNPAGVAFLNDGLHLSVNLQSAKQTREIKTTFPLFVNNATNPGFATHEFEGEANAPVIPSLQLAYNKNKWSFQFGFAITGGGGKCTFDNGLGSFEQVVGALTTKSTTLNQLYGGLAAAGVPGMAGHAMGNQYAYDSYMRGKQYYYGFTFGAAYKINDNLSVYGGLRMLYGSAKYYGYVKNIQVEHISNGVSEMTNASQHFTEQATLLNQTAGALQQMGSPLATTVAGYAGAMTQLATATQDIELNCDQEGWGVAPIIGVDYKVGKFNFAAKYEFKTRMRLKNKAANSESANNIAMLGKFKDGEKVAEDSPALLTVGAQYSLLPNVRINAGWHHFFDVDTKQYTKSMLGDTNEYLLGAEWDINKIVTVSAGGQRTQYDLKDDAMSDISFNVSSYSFGLGVAVNVAENVKINAAYFQTLYDDYTKTEPTAVNEFTRKNRVLGVGVDLKF